MINILSENAADEFSNTVIKKLIDEPEIMVSEAILETCEEFEISFDNPILKTLLCQPLKERLEQELIDANLLPDPSMGNNLEKYIE